MFFIMGISDGQKELSFVQDILCSNCHQYGKYQVFMTYTYLSLFFIPVIKWNRKYYVKTTCCNKTYELSEEVGKRIRRGENVTIKESDLIDYSTKWHYQSFSNEYTYSNPYKKCQYCGYETEEDFKFCPKCGKEFN